MRFSNLILSVALFLSCAGCGDAFSEEPSEADALAALKKHFRYYAGGEFDKFVETCAESVIIMPGGDLSARKFGFLAPGETDKPSTVERAFFIAQLKKVYEGRRMHSPEEVDEIMKAMKAENMKADPGDFAAVPPDGAERLGHIHFPIEKGDLLFKVSFQKGGDYSLYQMRSTAGGWKVVALCVD